MRLLFIHQNFPGQFRSLANHLSSRGHEVVAICSHQRPVDSNFKVVRYSPPSLPSVSLTLGQQIWYTGLLRSEEVARICLDLHNSGWTPDCILAHSGWGETISLHLVWPSTPQILWPELWVQPIHGGYGVDPILPKPNLDSFLDQIGRNALTKVALSHASEWVLPTIHQSSSFPSSLSDSRLHVVHEGIDTSIACPNPDISFKLRDTMFSRSVPTLTFVNRNLERLRGFDVFMRSLPLLQSKWPDLRIIIVGDSEKGYGTVDQSGKSLREIMLHELSGQLDLSRIYFVGRVPYDQFLAILQCSWVHVYLSYPFVLGWSLLEAMACGCAIVGSIDKPVDEVISNGIDGLLVPINDHILLSDRVSSLLADSDLRARFGLHARQTALKYDQNITLPKITRIIEKYS